ncbi:MAG TPA: ParB N-terminal domain-containing protein [Planctomycetes bacterium]|nr:ParB N-terminal domain-containing protein [Planctomycetota bacterium]HIJ69933.1 ParB N-terminal domain-containing protein [Planctomycetota bacterium]
MVHIKQIKSIDISKLIAHPANPNRMKDGTFRKLTAHIERTGNYEPVVVRPHPKRPGFLEIINGHHRVQALKKLGHTKCDCVVWRVDDSETMILLATLNRLTGHDELDKKAQLIKALSDRFSVKELSKQLPDTKRALERLKDLHRPMLPKTAGHKAFLNPVVFFLTDDQKRTVDEAIATIGAEPKETPAQRRARAITEIARLYLGYLAS